MIYEEKNFLWDEAFSGGLEKPKITFYIPSRKRGDCVLVIFPGGGYRFRAEHEGKGYAEFFAGKGIM